MRNVMVDLETLDKTPTSVIVSIGAVKFDASGISEDTFYSVVDIQSCIDLGLTISGDTIAWWMGQSEQARAVFKAKGDPLAKALIDFAKWVPKGAKVWGNGASFDNTILANAYGAISVRQPWDFWNDRCFRTVASFSPLKRVNSGVAHNALDDARSQAEHLLKIAPWACGA
jgi:hypothetical protein